jgi:hypothetical protein
MHLSTGTNFALDPATGDIPAWDANFGSGDLGLSPWVWLGDFNGDGKTDILSYVPLGGGLQAYANLSTGTGFDRQTWACDLRYTAPNSTWLGDFNGDGKTDIFALTSATTGTLNLSSGTGFIVSYYTDMPLNNVGYAGDFNGDGKTDIVSYSATVPGNKSMSSGLVQDLLVVASNGLGATTTVTYWPSSLYRNTLLPYVVQTVYSLSVNDGNNVTSTTEYLYSGGLYVHADRENYGFGYVINRSPTNTTGNPYRYTETYFTQRETGDVPNRHKGLVSAQLVSGTGSREWAPGALYAYTKNFYGDTGTPVFPHLDTRDDHICDGTSTCRRMRTNLQYDAYGNVTKKEVMECTGAIADVHDTTPPSCDSTPDMRIEYTTYAANTSAWILNRPIVTQVSDGTNKKAETQFAYDGATIGSSSVTRGNLTAKWDWNNYG